MPPEEPPWRVPCRRRRVSRVARSWFPSRRQRAWRGEAAKMPTGGLHFAGAGPWGVRALSGSFWGSWVASNEVGLLGLTGQGRGGRPLRKRGCRRSPFYSRTRSAGLVRSWNGAGCFVPIAGNLLRRADCSSAEPGTYAGGRSALANVGRAVPRGDAGWSLCDRDSRYPRASAFH
jgi:hypothetical protein